MIKHFKYLVYLYVLIAFSTAKAGSYEDFFGAIVRDDTSTITTLVLRGFDPNTLDPRKQHGLFLALRAGSLKAAKILIEIPQTDVNIANADGETPLMMAVLKGQVELTAALLAKDADVNKTGWTPLHYAATAGNNALIRMLLEKYAYIDAESPNGSTPLMLAAMYGTPSAVKLLLEEGADPLIKNSLGLTAIDFANQAQRQESADMIGLFLRSKQPKGKW
jgi:uncharacterized protein